MLQQVFFQENLAKSLEDWNKSVKLVCCLIDFQLNNAECFFIDKATERGDAVASLSEVNAVRWENRQVI